MVGDIIGAGLSTSLAIEAVRLLARIVESMDIVADNGLKVLCAFQADPELHDALCIWGASAELDEDGDASEEDYRAHPRPAAPEVVAPPVARAALASPASSPAASPSPAAPLAFERWPAVFAGSLLAPGMLASCGDRYIESVVRSIGSVPRLLAPPVEPAGAGA